jgi:PKHD-type hydroxylase
MLGEIFRLLDGDTVKQIVRSLERRTFIDGRVTASGKTLDVKHNLQVERTTAERSEIDETVLAAFGKHRDFQNYALPSRYVLPIFSRYEPGMTYGDHVDDSVMGGYAGVRTDLAATLFLSPPSSYDGGELVIEGREEIKLDCGEVFVYPAGTVHRVAPVTRGVRLAAVTWLQSAVRDERLRAILYDLSRALRHAESLGDRGFSTLLLKSYHNLIRYAAEP